MPRTAKRNPAAPSAAPATSPGQPYGVAGDQAAAMSQMPLAEGEQLTTQVPMNEAQAPSALPVLNQDQPNPEDLALMMEPPPEGGALGQDSAYPGERFSSGLTIGDGPGPEVVPLLADQNRRPGPVEATLAAIAAANGNDPMIRQLADRAAARKV